MTFLLLPLMALVGLSSTMAWSQQRTFTLSQFLEEVRTTSPDLAIAKANVDAAKAKAAGIRINPPMVGLMRMEEEGRINNGYEVSQEIPFPTKLIQDKKVRNLEFEAQKQSSIYLSAAVVSEARMAYVAFWNTYQRLGILKEKQAWLQHHLKLTRTTSWSDTSAKIHLLEVESEVDLVENEILALEAELIEKKTALKIFAPELNTDHISPSEPPLVSVQVQQSSPKVALKEMELQAREAMMNYEKQSFIPDLFVRLRGFNGNEMEPQSQELMVGVSVPFLYFWQPRAAVAGASAERNKAEAELTKAKVEFEFKLSSLKKSAEALEAQIMNLKTKLIPKAERRSKLVRNLSQRTMTGLDQHRSVVLGLLDLRTSVADLRLKHESVVSELIKITGKTTGSGAK